MGVTHYRLETLGKVEEVLAEALGKRGPVMVELDMIAIGDFATPFAGPAVKKDEKKEASNA
jgi:acetolactate synthase-1/2/3 large subunit